MIRPPGPMELGIILLIILIIFGAGKLPQVAGSIGKGIREFRRAKEGLDEESQAKAAKASNNSAEETGAKSGDN
ncbi:MAG: twin-arginine translocase TatA/TatE family subunit [Dehalococcoidia bacterium]